MPKEVLGRDTPFPMQTAQPPPAPPQKALETQQVSTRKGQGRGRCSPTCRLGLCSLWPHKAGPELSLFAAGLKQVCAHGMYADVRDVRVTYA